MAEISKPSNLSLTWASGGDVLNPGDTKYATGWNVEIPPRQWFNYLDNRQDSAIAHINQHGVVAWDNTTEYQEDKSYVQGVTNGTVYRCVQTHSGQNPETDVSNTYWIVAFASAGDFYTKSEADSTFLAKASNGSDIPNAVTFRTNISVYGKSETYTKTDVDGKTTVASTAQAQAETSNATLITPLRLAEWSQVKVIGVGQTWQDVTASRTWATTYTNTTGRAIQVSINTADPSVGQLSLDLYVSGIKVANSFLGIGQQTTVSAIVPTGATYRVERLDTNDTILVWAELR